MVRTLGRPLMSTAVLIENLPVPDKVVALARHGVWPTSENARLQNLRPLVSAERVRAFAPEEDRIYLRPIAEMRTVATEAESNRFWSEHGALSEIDATHSLIIGDFGLGSDAPIIAAFTSRTQQPSVWRLSWSIDAARNVSTTWVRCAETFDAFIEALGLTAPSKAP